tara:strand:+ start:4915 stop:5484 length:570 start_codon:yes stop_codon:yes gene_type:complete
MPLNFDLQKIKDENKCNIYFETGLWNVLEEDTSLCKALRMDFEKYYSVEIDSELVKICEKEFPYEIAKNKLTLFEGNSQLLHKYLSSITFEDTDRIIFFLDSHGHGHGCPLKEELTAIRDMNFKIKPIIILDDVRIIRDCIWSDDRFSTERQNHSFEDILKDMILEIDPNYKFSYLDGYVKDDCLLCSV